MENNTNEIIRTKKNMNESRRRSNDTKDASSGEDKKTGEIRLPVRLVYQSTESPFTENARYASPCP